MRSHARISQLTALVLTAAAYYVCGRLGLMLAIPPGYATAVWPASGVALAAVIIFGWGVLPGVLLGSLLVNIGTNLDTAGLFPLLRSLMVPVAIALGATTQAAMGAWLTQRFAGRGNILTLEVDVIRLLLLGGPVACLICPSAGVGILSFTGVITDDALQYSWLTWWVGDSIGVMIFTPLILVWGVRPYRTWIAQQLWVSVPLVLMFAVVLLVFINTSKGEQARLERDFANRATRMTENFQDEMDRYRVALKSLSGLLSNSGVTNTEFERFADLLLGQLSGLHAVSWNPVVLDAQRAQFEARMRREGYTDFGIFELGPDGEKLPAKRRDSYVPVAFIRHSGIPDNVQGFDIASNPERKAGLERAALSRELSSTGSIKLVSQARNSSGILFFLPVFDPGIPDRLMGYATLVIRLQSLMAVLTNYLPLEGMELQLLDHSGPSGTEVLLGESEGILSSEAAVTVSKPVKIAQREWELRYRLPADYMLAHRSWQAWIALAVGLLLTTLFGLLLLTIVGRSARVEILVRERTAEVRQSEDRFRTLLDSAPDAMVIVNTDGRINLVNSQAEEIFGYTKAELIGQPVENLMPARFREPHKGHLSGYWADPQARPMGAGLELLGRRQDGSEFPIEISLSPLQIGMDRVVTATIRDVTERKKAENRLNRAMSVLAATLESTADGILVVDNEGKVVSFNQKFIEMWNIPEQTRKLKDDNLLLQSVLPQLEDPEGFLAKVRQLYERPDEESNDLITFKDGRILERYSRPQYIDDEIIGRVWSFRDITERKLSEARILQMAQQDALTRLPNRTLLMDRLEQALALSQRSGKQVAVMLLDLDRFKHVNDSLGHHVGDDLLLGVAERLQLCIRRSDTLARMGGDEFVIVLPDVGNRADVSRIAANMLKHVSEKMVVGSHEFVTTASIGISLFPEHGADAATLIKQADAAMYHAKAMGRGNFQWFDSSMLQAVENRLELERSLRRALEKDEFELHYQPLLSINSGEVVGIEALLRWNDPIHGIVGPDRFITPAEETGLIVPIGEWVLRQACSEAEQMQKELGIPLVTAVNVSAAQFRLENIVELVKDALSSSGFEPKNLVLEITESVLATNTKETVRMLQDIRALGVRIAVDDFGTGYSSLSYITRFPIDILKIDRSFIRDINEDENDAAITRAIIAMAHSLKIEVVAEGVETWEQLVFLREHGCDKAQGFYFSDAVPADKLVHRVNEVNQQAAGTGRVVGQL